MKQYKPATPGLRQKRTVVYAVDKVAPQKALMAPKKGAVGRSHGRITSQSRQQGSKKQFRLIDYKREKHGIPAVVHSIEYDPNRGPNLALLAYRDGEKRYILAPEGLKRGDVVVSGPDADPTVGNALPLEKIPLNTPIHCLEITPTTGAKMVRGAGLSAQLIAKEDGYGIIKLPSSEVRKLPLDCYAVMGSLSNFERRQINLGKAGTNRYMGRRPHTRGVAMADPSDHPHAGSYKTSGIGLDAPRSPWGWKTKGFKTRRRQNTRKFIVSGRASRRIK